MSAPVGSLTLTLTRGGPSVFLKCRFETLRTDGPHPLRSVHPVRVLPAMVKRREELRRREDGPYNRRAENILPARG